MNATVLVVDDEPDVLDLVKYNLHRAGFQVLVAKNGSEGLAMAKTSHPDVIVLDVMMPGLTGIEVCRELKTGEATADIPIVMLTAKSGQPDRISGLEMGADDYIGKPFSPRELVLRVQALVRRLRSGAKSGILKVEPFAIDKSNFEIAMSGQKLDLTTTEFKLLCLLVERRGKIQSRENLLYDVWGYENAIDTRTVDTHVRRLREKLGPHASRIETARGLGYRFTTSEPSAEE